MVPRNIPSCVRSPSPGSLALATLFLGRGKVAVSGGEKGEGKTPRSAREASPRGERRAEQRIMKAIPVDPAVSSSTLLNEFQPSPEPAGLMQERSHQFNTLQLLQAYERAIDQNIISSITDTTGQIIYVNRKFCQTSKYSAAELVGQNHRIVNSGHHPAGFFQGLWRTISAGNVWHDEIRNRAKDGTHYWVDTVIVPIKDDKQQITHYLSLRTLITEKKRLEHDRGEAHQALKVLLVMTSEKVRRPLSHCLAQMSLLDSGGPRSSAEIATILKDLRSSASALDEFTRDLATFIRDMEMNLSQES